MKKLLMLGIVGSMFLTFHQATAVVDQKDLDDANKLAKRIGQFNQGYDSNNPTPQNKTDFADLYQDARRFYRDMRGKYVNEFKKSPPQDQAKLKSFRDFLEAVGRFLYKPLYTHSPELPPGVMPILALILGGMVLGLRRLFSRQE